MGCLTMKISAKGRYALASAKETLWIYEHLAYIRNSEADINGCNNPMIIRGLWY